jgi:phage shock protein A
MIDTLFNDLLKQLAEPFQTDLTLDWYLNKDVIQRLQKDQEEECLLWQARANVAKKKKRYDLVEAALARRSIHEHRAKLHGNCLQRVKQCIQRVR